MGFHSFFSFELCYGVHLHRDSNRSNGIHFFTVSHFIFGFVLVSMVSKFFSGFHHSFISKILIWVSITPCLELFSLNFIISSSQIDHLVFIYPLDSNKPSGFQFCFASDYVFDFHFLFASKFVFGFHNLLVSQFCFGFIRY